MRKDYISIETKTFSVFNSSTNELVQGSQNSTEQDAQNIITQLESDSNCGEEFHYMPYNPEKDLVSEEILAVTIAA